MRPSCRRRAAWPRLVLMLVLTAAACSDDGGDPATPDMGPVGGTVVRGVVLDGEQQPVVGAQATVGQASAQSDSQGRFALSLPEQAEPTLVLRAQGYARTERQLDLARGLLDLGPIVLTPLTASAAVSSAGGQVGSSAAGVTVTVPAGAFSGQVTLELTLLPLGDPLLDPLRLPLPIPQPAGAAVAPLFALVLDAEGQQPQQPLAVTVTTAAALPQGTKVPLGRYDPSAGAWVDQGQAVVSADGALQLSLDHLSTFAAALPAVPDAGETPAELDGLTNVPAPFRRGEPRVDPRSGALQVGVDLPPVVRRGQTMQLTLFHDSRTPAPRISVPMALPKAQPGESAVVQARTPFGVQRAQVTVSADVDQQRPAVVVSTHGAATGSAGASDGGAPAAAEAIPTGSHAVATEVLRLANATLHASRNGSFAEPALGSVLELSDGSPVAAPTKIPLRNMQTRAAAVDNRRHSAFGPGWHLRGLTRLVQPWCSEGQVTLVGGFETPAVTFGKNPELYLQQVEQALVDAGLALDDLSSPPLLAWAKDALYVGVQRAADAELWRVDSTSGAAQRVVGGKSATGPSACTGAADQLTLRELTGLGAAPGGDGVLMANEDCVLHIKADGSTSRLAGGTGSNILPGPKVKLDAVDFVQEVQRFTAGRAPGVWLIETWLWGPYLVRDGELQSLRTRVTHPHGLTAAFDAQGELVYTAPGSPCVYRHDDGLNDEPLFPACKDGTPGELADGPAQSAKVGQIEAMAYDAAGNLWFIDATFKALRRMSPDGLVTTVAGGDADAEPTGEGGPASAATLGALYTLAVSGAFGGPSDSPAEEDRVALGGVKRLLRLERGAAGTLQGLGAADGSQLSQQPDKTWLRVLVDGTQERYDARGLLVHRGRPGEPGLDYVYAAWSDTVAQESCGAPATAPLLQQIELAGEKLFIFEWDQGRLGAVTDAAGQRTTLSWDGGRVASIALPQAAVALRYDAQGRVIERSSAGPAGSPVVWSYGYTDGRLSSVQVPRRGTLTFAAAEQAAEIPSGKLSAAGIAQDVVARPAEATVPAAGGASAKLGLGPSALRVEAPDGSVTTLQMDQWGRTIREQRPDGSVLAITRDAAGRILELHNQQSGERWRYSYNSQGLLSQRVDPAGRLVSYLYNTNGRLSSRKEPGGASLAFAYKESGAAAGLPTSVTDALGRVTTMAYDSRGNLVSSTSPAGATTQVERDKVGRAVRVTEASGLVHLTSYDSRGGITAQSLGEGTGAASISYKRVLADGWHSVGSHVPASAMMAVTDPLGRSWSFQRDAAFQLTRMETPGEGVVLQTFDDQGRRTKRQTEDGSAETFQWNAAGRLQRRTFSGPAAGAWLELSYDELGRVAKLIDPLLTETRSFAPGLGWTSVTLAPTSSFDEAARFTLTRARPAPALSTQTLEPTRFTLHSEYDHRSARVELERTDQSGSARDVLVFTRNAARELTQLTRGNGTVTVRTYDSAGRVVQQQEQSSAGTLTLSWTYDSAGRPATMTVDGVTRSYTYDDRGRLAACSDTGEQYTYDAAGARKSAGGASYSRDARGRLTSDGVSDYTYDALGRRTSRVSKSDPADKMELLYGAGGRLSEVKLGGSSVVSYSYDGSGRLVRRTTAAGNWHYGYLPDSDRPVRVVQPDGTVWHLVHAWGSAPFSMAVSEGGAERYVHLDPFDRVVGISDETGKLWRVTEDCYGRPGSGAAPAGPRVGFHGMLWDPDAGLYHAGGRSYDPATGEFLQPDPAGIEAGPDPWGYAGGNPVLAGDPSGRILFWALAGAIVTGVAIANEIRKFSQSREARRARQSYKDMTEVNESDDKLRSAEKAHKRLYRAADKGGDTAIKCTRKAIETVTNPASDGMDVLDQVKDEVADPVQSILDAAKGEDAGGES